MVGRTEQKVNYAAEGLTFAQAVSVFPFPDPAVLLHYRFVALTNEKN
jgi:hypothetical protein